MINLRYHIVSIVAVFLALGIGLALGSTFISGAVVSRLEDDIDDLRSEADSLQAQRDEARAELEAVESGRQGFEEQALPVIGGGRLDGHRVLVLTTTGVDDDMLDPLEIGLAGSSAQFVGTLRITPRLDLGDPVSRAGLAALLGVPDDDQLGRALETQLSAALVPDEPLDPGTTLGQTVADVAAELVADDALVVAPPAGVPPRPLVSRLVDEGFLEYDDEIVNRRVPVDDLVEHGTRYVFVSDVGADVPHDEVLLPLIRTMHESEELVPGVAAGSSAEPGAEQPDLVEAIRMDGALAAGVSTIDDLDNFSGLLATLAALDQVPFVGHYGVGAAADSLLPGPR